MGKEIVLEEVWTYAKPTRPEAPNEHFLMRFEYDQWVKVEPEALHPNDLIRLMGCKGHVLKAPKVQDGKYCLLVSVVENETIILALV